MAALLASTADELIGCQEFRPRNLNLSFLCTLFFQENEKKTYLIQSNDIYNVPYQRATTTLAVFYCEFNLLGGGRASSGSQGWWGGGAAEAEEIAERTIEAGATWVPVVSGELDISSLKSHHPFPKLALT